MALRHQRAERRTVLIRKGDNVKVMSGRDAGKVGRVLAVNARENTVTVEHANIIKRHTRPNPAKNVKGGIVEKEAAMNAKHTRIGHVRLPDGEKARSCRRCGTTLDK